MLLAYLAHENVKNAARRGERADLKDFEDLCGAVHGAALARGSSPQDVWISTIFPRPNADWLVFLTLFDDWLVFLTLLCADFPAESSLVGVFDAFC